jgi:hypothetical protein
MIRPASAAQALCAAQAIRVVAKRWRSMMGSFYRLNLACYGTKSL